MRPGRLLSRIAAACGGLACLLVSVAATATPVLPPPASSSLGVVFYLVCDQAHLTVDPVTGAARCSAVQFVQSPSFLPYMPVSAAAAISVAILTVWALAALYRRL